MKFAAVLMAELKRTGDQRATGGAEVFDHYPYYGGKIGQTLYPNLK